MPVSDAEIDSLATTYDIVSLGTRADDARRERHGNRTTFVRVATLVADADGAIVWPAAVGEVRIVGAPVSLAAAAARVSAVKKASAGVPVSAFSLADLETLAVEAGATLCGILEELAAAGLDLVAEAPIDRLRDPRRAIDDVAAAGLALARLTIDQLAPGDSVAMFRTVADLQQQVGVIRAFAPLARRVNPALPTTGYDDIRRVALARLVVANVPSIQVDWSLYGPKLAQVALTVGVDDVDAVSAESESAMGRRRAPLEEITRHIVAAGQTAVERNGRFEILG
jgi:aminodeoxyfutalosine synthase